MSADGHLEMEMVRACALENHTRGQCEHASHRNTHVLVNLALGSSPWLWRSPSITSLIVSR